MRNPLPTNVDLLIFLANQTGHSYDDAYAVWREFYRSPDAYLITETVLTLASRYHLPVMAAVAVYRQGPQGEFVRNQPST